jgi:putative Mg2+ transporter-C (MgtC) family protein
MVEVFSALVSDQLVLILNASIAAILGSIIGWERDRAGKSAGP